jgi:hypothetical protein
VPGTTETSFLTRAAWRNIPEDTILHSHRRENLKSYICGYYLYFLNINIIELNETMEVFLIIKFLHVSNLVFFSEQVHSDTLHTFQHTPLHTFAYCVRYHIR